MKKFFASSVVVTTVLIATNLFAASVRERVSFNDDWRFQKSDDTNAAAKLNYAAVRDWLLPTAKSFLVLTNAPARPAGNIGADVPFTQPSFDDRGWRRLNLPHDFGIEGAFQQSLPGGTGRLPWSGVAWYRKHFTVSGADRGRQISLDVDGAMAYATVWLNGQCIGGWPYGYASWRVDLTPYLKFGGENVIVIRLDNPPDSSRWYPGGGIYRNVWLVKTGPVHVGQWGTYITTPEVSKAAATISVKTTIKNDSATPAHVNATTALYEVNAAGSAAGQAIAVLTASGVDVAAGSSSDSTATFKIGKPKLWSIKTPQLYVAVTTIEKDGETADTYATKFGIRKIEFTATNGFLLNGERVPINGVCDHADLGALGSAINTRGLERQLEILKAMGCNAIRTSHNPPARELLDLCDKMGFLVMDETFDCWRSRKTANDYHLLYDDWHEADTRMLIRRDRNHPCVILWSIGNEVGEQGNTNNLWIAQNLADIVHSEDPTRCVTAACNDTRAAYNGFQKIVDVYGFNYKPNEYGKFRAANPTIPVFGSETASTISSRGEYFFPVTNNKGGGKSNNQVSSYDLYAPSWATPPDTEFKGQEQNPFVAGEFVWTGFDYLGEPTPYGLRTDSARSSYFGIIDLAGFPKDRYYLYQAHWRPDFAMAHILPHWNWPDRVGQVTPVHVYTSGDEAELFLNGKSLGRKKKSEFEYRLRWDEVVYQPGELKVVAYKNGRKWATDVMRTTGPASKLTLAPDRANISADGKDLSYITVTVADKKGLLVPQSKNHIQFEIEGPGEIVAVDNGDATSFEPFQAKEHSAYNGLALVIVRSTKENGKIKLTAKSDGLATATVTIRSR